MLRLPLRTLSGLVVLACAALGVACGDASTTSAQNWQNQSPVTGGSTSTTTTGNDSDAAASTTTTTDTDAASAAGGDADVGEGDGGEAADGASTTTDKLTVTSALATSTLDLASTTKIPVTIAAAGGYTGMATLSVTGLPADVTATWDESSVSLATGTATANLTLTSLSSTVQQTNNYSIVATPTGGSPSSLTASVAINSKLTIHLPVNLEAMIGTAKYNNGNPVMITAPADLSATHPISIVMHNDDTSDYFEIHVNGTTAGFVHGVAAIAPGTDETFGSSNPRVINAKATVSFYMHGYGNTASMATGGSGGGSGDFPGTITVQ